MYALVTGVQTCALPIYGSAPRSIHHQVQSAVHKQLVAWINDDCRAIRCDFINAVAINKQREYALRKRRVGARHPSHRIMYSLFPCTCRGLSDHWNLRSEEQTYELKSLMRISYAVFCVQKKHKQQYKQIPT